MIEVTNMLLRAKQVVLYTFVLIASGLLALVALKPKKYEAHMSFLVRNERTDPLISTDPHETAMKHGEVTEEDINSEVELLGSAELLHSVAKASGLDKEFLKHGGAEDLALEKATRKLSKALVITPVRKSALITVDYTSEDRDGSVKVLKAMTELYLEKHTMLYTAGSAAPFFRQKSVGLERQLRDAENQRASIVVDNGFSLLAQQRQLRLQQMLDIEKARDEAHVLLAETRSRLQQVIMEQRANEPRLLTQERVSANQYSIERLNTMLAEMQNRRTELATKFKTGDRLLGQVNQEIADTRAALDRAQQLHSQDTTTDVNPIRQNLDAEAYRLKQTEAGLMSRSSALDRQLVEQRSHLGKMERASIAIDAYDRNIKELAGSLEQYREKAVAAGIAEDLDMAKISNVVVASQPIVPVLPAPSPLNTITALALAVLMSLGAGLLSEVYSNNIYGTAGIEGATNISVLAAFTRESHST